MKKNIKSIIIIFCLLLAHKTIAMNEDFNLNEMNINIEELLKFLGSSYGQNNQEIINVANNENKNKEEIENYFNTPKKIVDYCNDYLNISKKDKQKLLTLFCDYTQYSNESLKTNLNIESLYNYILLLPISKNPEPPANGFIALPACNSLFNTNKITNYFAIPQKIMSGDKKNLHLFLKYTGYNNKFLEKFLNTKLLKNTSVIPVNNSTVSNNVVTKINSRVKKKQ